MQYQIFEGSQMKKVLQSTEQVVQLLDLLSTT